MKFISGQKPGLINVKCFIHTCDVVWQVADAPVEAEAPAAEVKEVNLTSGMIIINVDLKPSPPTKVKRLLLLVALLPPLSHFVQLNLTEHISCLR